MSNKMKLKLFYSPFLYVAIFIGYIISILLVTYNQVFEKSIYYISLDESSYLQLIRTGTFNISSDNISNGKFMIKEVFKTAFLDYLLYTIIALLVMFLFVFLQSKLFRKYKKKIEHDFTKDLSSINFVEDVRGTDESFEVIKGKLESVLESQLLDYRKINSYISHEQKNILAILKSKAELMGNEEIIRTVDSLMNSVDELLTLSDISDSQEVSDIALITAEVCDIYNNERIEVTLTSDITDVFGKKRWIQQAISNLISNALKYGDGKKVKVKVEVKRDTVILSVKDYGKGIDDDLINEIFNYKYRINHLNEDGYGIGLNLVNHVCDLCNAFVYVDTSKEGTTFYLSFPLVD